MSQLFQYYKNFQATHFPARAPLPNLTPTFEDLSIDESLTELQRLVKYARSSIGLQRLVHVKMMHSIAVGAGFEETKNKVVPILEGLSHDTEPAVRQHFVEQLGLVAKYCGEHGEDGYQIVVTKILPIAARLLEDDKAEVRQAACSTLVSIASIIRIEDIGQYVLTIILRLAHEDDKEERRMTAAELLNSLAECLGQDLCKQFVIPEVVSLAEDPAFRVRKATALNFHFVCKIGGEHELFERLMPAFVRLSKDDMYRVRRACAESLSEISKYVDDDIRVGVLVEIFLRLAQDPSRVVKQSVLQQSGMFISTLPARAVNENILSQFCSMASNPTGEAVVDNELKHFCAFSFPAVLLTVGAGKWKQLRPLYQQLVKCTIPTVRQTLAASLHEIAKLLATPSVVEEELLPIFEEFIQESEPVQMGVIKHLADFLKMLSVPCRLSFLPMLHDILHTTNPFNWRLRQCLAIQLPELIALPPVENLYNSLCPLVTTLLQDSVVSVRRYSYKGVAALINALATEAAAEAIANTGRPPIAEAQLDEVATVINILARGDTYNMRLVWIELCRVLLREIPQPLFEKYFVEGILAIASDTITNVRIAGAALIAGWEPEDLAPWETFDPSAATAATSSLTTAGSQAADEPIHRNRPSPWTWLLQRYDIQQCVLRLARDDRDIVAHMRKLQPMFPDVEFKEISCRGMKFPPGGARPVELCKESSDNPARLVQRYDSLDAQPSANTAISDDDHDEAVSVSADAASDIADCRDRSPSLSSHSESDVDNFNLGHVVTDQPLYQRSTLALLRGEGLGDGDETGNALGEDGSLGVVLGVGRGMSIRPAPGAIGVEEVVLQEISGDLATEAPEAPTTEPDEHED